MSNITVKDEAETPSGLPQEAIEFRPRLPAIPWKGNLGFDIPRRNRKNGCSNDPSHPPSYYGGTLDIEPLGTWGYMTRRYFPFPFEAHRSVHPVSEVMPIPSIDLGPSRAEVRLSKQDSIDVDKIREKLAAHGICNCRRVCYTAGEWKEPTHITGPDGSQSPSPDRDPPIRTRPFLSPPNNNNETRLSCIAFSQLKLDNLNLTLALDRMERDFNAKLDAQDRRLSEITTEHAVKISEHKTKLGDCKWQLDRGVKEIVILKFKLSILEKGTEGGKRGGTGVKVITTTMRGIVHMIKCK